MHFAIPLFGFLSGSISSVQFDMAAVWFCQIIFLDAAETWHAPGGTTSIVLSTTVVAITQHRRAKWNLWAMIKILVEFYTLSKPHSTAYAQF